MTPLVHHVLRRARELALALTGGALVACAPGAPETDAAAPDTDSLVASTAADTSALRFVGLTAGRQFTCGLDEAGAAWCWGANRFGQLGIGDTLDRFVPTRVVYDTRFTRIMAGETHTCAVDSLATLHCWGDNRDFALADTTVRFRDRPAPLPVRGVRQLALGRNVTCITDATDRPLCWGTDRHGERGDNRLGSAPLAEPRAVRGDLRFDKLTVGRQHACGLTSQGAAWCWGDGGALGDGTLTDRGAPVEVQGNRRFRELAAGESITCGLKVDGSVWCWGVAFDGQLGQGSPPRPNTFLPAPVSGSLQFRQLAPGHHRVCALDVSGRAWCWGSNYNGGLGDGSGQSQSEPVRVAGDLAFTTLAAGDYHTCALDEAGAAWCWGENSDARGGGALGDGTMRSRSVPTRVAAPAETRQP